MTVYAGEYYEALLDLSGTIRPDFPVAIRNPNGTAATLYTSRMKEHTTSNEVSSDSIGNLHFWADPGVYIGSAEFGDFPITVYADPSEPITDAEILEAGRGLAAGPVIFSTLYTIAGDGTWKDVPGFSLAAEYQGKPLSWQARMANSRVNAAGSEISFAWTHTASGARQFAEATRSPATASQTYLHGCYTPFVSALRDGTAFGVGDTITMKLQALIPNGQTYTGQLGGEFRQWAAVLEA